MKLSRVFRLSIFCAAMTAGLSGIAQGQDVSPAVKARQGLMQLYAFNLGQLNAMTQGTTAYDADAATKLAQNIAALSRMGSSALWPQGSSIDDIIDTAALPAIWENPADLGAKAMALSQAADALADAAGQGADALQGAMMEISGACRGCHQNYRQRD